VPPLSAPPSLAMAVATPPGFPENQLSIFGCFIYSDSTRFNEKTANSIEFAVSILIRNRIN
jgi:hypothetical protein